MCLGINESVLDANENVGSFEEIMSNNSLKSSNGVVFGSNEQVQNACDLTEIPNHSNEMPNGDNEIHDKKLGNLQYIVNDQIEAEVSW